jgi:hypothetical protein
MVSDSFLCDIEAVREMSVEKLEELQAHIEALSGAVGGRLRELGANSKGKGKQNVS